jgi:2-desacetyl-2-hydroxyethyl bacteriochlorophyllide A dehydrogenase
MKAVTLIEPGKLAAVHLPEPEAPGADEALVRVHRIGVCGTDIHAFAGKQPFFTYPRVLGHELGVEVLAIGRDVTHVRVGDRCAVEPYLNCQRCIACRRGKPNCCASLRVLGVHSDGGMRERFTLPARKLHPSTRLPYDQLALIEPLAIGCHAVDRARLVAGETVLVIGAGPIGLAVIQFAVEAGAEVIVLDINASRLEFCRRELRVTHTIHGKHDDVPARLRQLTGDDLPTAVLDATGNPSSMATAFSYPAPGGRLVFVGLFPGDVTFHDPDFHRRELTLLASRNARPEDFTRIIGLIEADRIDPAPWITHRASFDDVVNTFPGWTAPEAGVVKAQILL